MSSESKLLAYQGFAFCVGACSSIEVLLRCTLGGGRSGFTYPAAFWRGCVSLGVACFSLKLSHNASVGPVHRIVGPSDHVASRGSFLASCLESLPLQAPLLLLLGGL